MVLTVIDTDRPEAPLRRRYWRCEGCRGIMGEVIGESLLIARGAFSWVVPLSDTGVTAHCRCGRYSQLNRDEAERVTAA